MDTSPVDAISGMPQRDPCSRRAAAGLLAALGLGGSLALGQRSAAAEASTPRAGSPFVGSWQRKLTWSGAPSGGGLPPMVLDSIGSDGTFTSAAPAVLQAPPGAPFKLAFISGGHGVWQPVGTDTIAFTFVHLQSDEQGRLQGTVTVRGRLILGADGNSLTGPLTATITDPSGAVVANFAATSQGRRIGVEAMATPVAGTPTG
jgi:hypothetical protein